MTLKSWIVDAAVRCTVSNGSNQKARHLRQISTSTGRPRTPSTVRDSISLRQPGQSTGEWYRVQCPAALRLAGIHALEVTRAYASTDPSPVARSYPTPASHPDRTP